MALGSDRFGLTREVPDSRPAYEAAQDRAAVLRQRCANPGDQAAVANPVGVADRIAVEIDVGSGV